MFFFHFKQIFLYLILCGFSLSGFSSINYLGHSTQINQSKTQNNSNFLFYISCDRYTKCTDKNDKMYTAAKVCLFNGELEPPFLPLKNEPGCYLSEEGKLNHNKSSHSIAYYLNAKYKLTSGETLGAYSFFLGHYNEGEFSPLTAAPDSEKLLSGYLKGTKNDRFQTVPRLNVLKSQWKFNGDHQDIRAKNKRVHPNYFLTPATYGDAFYLQYTYYADPEIYRGDLLNFKVNMQMPEGLQILSPEDIKIQNRDGGEFLNLSKAKQLKVETKFVRLGQTLRISFLVKVKKSMQNKTHILNFNSMETKFIEAHEMKRVKRLGALNGSYSSNYFGFYIQRPELILDMGFPTQDVSNEDRHGTHVLIPGQEDHIYLDLHQLRFGAMRDSQWHTTKYRKIHLLLKLPKGLEFVDHKVFDSKKMRIVVEKVSQNEEGQLLRISCEANDPDLLTLSENKAFEITLKATEEAPIMTRLKPALTLESVVVGEGDDEFSYEDYESTEISPISFIVQD